MAMFSDQLSYGWRCVAISFDSLFRWSVPAFIMISGAILAVPRPGKGVLGFYKKRLGRIGLPIVFWSAFFMCFDIYYVQFSASNWSQSLANLADGRPYGHMFFIFRFVGLYALAPAVQWLNAHASRKVFAGITIGLFIAVAVDSYLQNQAGEQRGFVIGTFYFLPYFMAGYLLRTAYLSRRGIAIALCLWALATAALVFSTVFGVDGWAGRMVPPSPEFAMWDHVSPIRIVIGLSMWCVLITVLRGPKLKQPFFRFMSNVIAPAAFGLYLIHPLFRDGLHKLGVTAVEPNLWVGVPLTMTAIIIWTIALTVCIMRIPYLRRIVV
jgi:surface polysaccharide O-acyltransferase-like enzyme